MKHLLLCSILALGSVSHAVVAVNGAGSTFAEPLYTRWMSDFEKKNKDSQFNYQGIGSGAGIRQLLEGTVDFAGTDDPMKAEEEAKAKAPVLHVPIALGSVVISYNLPDSPTLKLSGPIVAKMFDGRLTKWNDAEIAKLNPGVKLPDLAVAVATRSDGSGTTAVFSEYLSKVDAAWKGKNGKTVKWFSGSLGAKGNAGVAGLIKQAPGTVGYVELVYAAENKLPMASLENQKKEFIEASAKSTSAAAAGLKNDAVSKDFKLSITDSAQKGAYPIASFTWMLVPTKMSKAKGTEIVKFAKWAMGDEAQGIAGQINYAPVPKEIRGEVLKRLEKVQFE